MEDFIKFLSGVSISRSDMFQTLTQEKAYEPIEEDDVSMASTSSSSSSHRYLRSQCDGSCNPTGLIKSHRHRVPKRKLESSLSETSTSESQHCVKRSKRTTIELFDSESRDEGEEEEEDNVLEVVKRSKRIRGRSESTSSSGSSHYHLHHHRDTTTTTTATTTSPSLVDHNHNLSKQNQQQQLRQLTSIKQKKKKKKSAATSDNVKIAGDQDDDDHNYEHDSTCNCSPCKDIRKRYEAYLRLSQEERDQSKTDYTYAHSFSYSPTSVKAGQESNWIVPNMSRTSVRANSAAGTMTTSTRSTYHRSAFLEQDSVSRSIVNNLPVSEIKPPNTRSRKTTSNNANAMYHSTPINAKRNHIGTRLEYSDDEEDQLNQTVVRNVSAKVAVRVPDDEIARYSEEDDEEDMTIIRKVTWVVRRTFRNLFYPSDDSTTGNGDVTKHLASDEFEAPGPVYLKSRVINRPTSSGQTRRRRSLLSLWWLPLLLLAVFVPPYWYLSSNYQMVNLLEDISQSSSSSFAWYFPYDSIFSAFRQSGDGGGGPDLSRLTSELNSLRSEVQMMKEKYGEHPESPPPPSHSDTNREEILARLALLESCCKKNLTAVLEEELKHLFKQHTEHLQERFDGQMYREVQKLKTYLVNYVRDHASPNSERDPKTTAMDSAYIEQLIKTALAKYDADKTGQADFALESSGAWIVSTRCSETYELSTATYKIFGIPIWRAKNTPRVVIQSGVVPGECWCFRGGQGRVAVHLSARIIPTAFSYEHIPVSLSRDGHILSAPADISVYGLKVEDDPKPSLLGHYHYSIDENSDPLQRFEVQHTETAKFTFRYIELVVNSNHGHSEYTCLYRFRVHGTPVRETTD